jgi:DNA helicase-2/ATP-dependent DNA helicase PcrA
VADVDSLDHDSMVNIMTIHAAKGLEFSHVFLPGWEEGVFPHQRAIQNPRPQEIEEERRLAYVAITRARKSLSISYAQSRRMYQQWQHNPPSRFIYELPEEVLRMNNNFVVEKTVVPLKPKNQTTHAWQIADDDGRLRPGDLVAHTQFGQGIILALQGDRLDIAFKTVGKKTILKDFIRAVGAEEIF